MANQHHPEDTQLNNLLGNRVVRRINVKTGKIYELNEEEDFGWPFPFPNTLPNRKKLRACLSWASKRLTGEYPFNMKLVDKFTSNWTTPIGAYLSDLLIIIETEPTGNYKHYKPGTFSISMEGYETLHELSKYFKEEK